MQDIIDSLPVAQRAQAWRSAALARMLAEAMDTSDATEMMTLERLFPGYGQQMFALRRRPDLLKVVKRQLALGPPESAAPCNVQNHGFGGV